MKNRIRRYITFLFIVLVFGLGKSVFAQAYLKEVKSGNHLVGFRSFHVYDASRPNLVKQKGRKSGRMLQVNVWYPSKEKSNKKFTFKDYTYLKNQESSTANVTNLQKQNSIKQYFRWVISAGTSQAEVDKLLNQNLEMMATKEAVPKNGKYPLVLLIHGSAVDYAFLGEFLASYGFISINAPTKGYLQDSLEVSGIGMETQIRDYEYIIPKIAERFNSDAKNLGVVGFSFGGQSSIGFMMRNPNVKAMVSLDGGNGSKFGSRLIRQSPFYNLSRINKPLLHLYNPADSYTDLTSPKGYVFSNRVFIGFNEIDHGHFTSFGMLNKFAKITFNKKTASENVYEAIIKLTLDFMTAYLKNNNFHKQKIQNRELNLWVKKELKDYQFLEGIK